jgi:hypothetical protein
MLQVEAEAIPNELARFSVDYVFSLQIPAATACAPSDTVTR